MVSEVLDSRCRDNAAIDDVSPLCPNTSPVRASTTPSRTESPIGQPPKGCTATYLVKFFWLSLDILATERGRQPLHAVPQALEMELAGSIVPVQVDVGIIEGRQRRRVLRT